MDKHIKSETIPLENVKINEEFWVRYLEILHNVMLPYQWEILNDRVPGAEPSHAIKNFKIAAGLEQGEYYGMIFQDSDVAKWLEAVSYRLTTHPDKEIEQIADQVIDIIEKAQQSDGYLNTYYTVKEPGKRWTNLREGHELYCAGHMMEAAVAYYKATGKKKLLNIMCRFADHIDSIFGQEPEKIKGYPGHQEIELALFRLYEVTGEKKYMRLSRYFLLERGKEPYYFDMEAEKRGNTFHFPEFKDFDRKYSQSHLEIYKQTVAEGHAVRAVYMYTAMADIASETGDEMLTIVCKNLWTNIIEKRMYITGSIGSASFGERFTTDYDLPNDTNYSETCASIGLIFFAYRMLKLEADNVYGDIMEKALYNTVLSGVALDGKSFFYVNPLEVIPDSCFNNPAKFHVKPIRQKWFSVACCPPNIARLLASLGQYIYTVSGNTIYTHLYIGSEAEIDVDGSRIVLRQETNYPLEGKIRLVISVKQGKEFTIGIRLPGWCTHPVIAINGEAVCLKEAINKGYAMLGRTWSDGDIIDIELPMEVMLMHSHPKLQSNSGKAAIQRGPLVYCIEEADNGSNLSSISILKETEWRTQYDKNLLGGTMVVTGKGMRINESLSSGQLYNNIGIHEVPVQITAVPYYLWSNRGIGEMQTWIRCK